MLAIGNHMEVNVVLLQNILRDEPQLQNCRTRFILCRCSCNGGDKLMIDVPLK